jgi:hypothetical protein
MFCEKLGSYNYQIQYLIRKHKINNIMSIHMNFHQFICTYVAKNWEKLIQFV